MKNSYVAPQVDIIDMCPAQMLCLSLTGGTESMSQSDMEDIIFDDIFLL